MKNKFTFKKELTHTAANGTLVGFVYVRINAACISTQIQTAGGATVETGRETNDVIEIEIPETGWKQDFNFDYRGQIYNRLEDIENVLKRELKEQAENPTTKHLQNFLINKGFKPEKI